MPSQIKSTSVPPRIPGRVAALGLAALLALIFFIPYCGLLFNCGCRMLWEGGAHHCNAYMSSHAHCPFCNHGQATFYLIAGLPLLTVQMVSFKIARHAGFFSLLGILLGSSLLVVAATAYVAAIHDQYHRSQATLVGGHAVHPSIHDGHDNSSGHFDHTILNNLLATSVDDHGWVDYDALRANRQALNQYLAGLADAEPEEFADDHERLAFWINAYNAFTLADVLDDVYGKALGVREVPGFFNGKRHPIADQQLSLDEIEERGRVLDDPRIHFGLVCASTSCPKLRRQAYEGSLLDAQLDQAARDFLSDPARGARMDSSHNQLILSPIFKWYAGDFTGHTSSIGRLFARVKSGMSSGGVLGYLETYAPSDMKRFVEDRHPEVVYSDYDWSLNSQSGHRVTPEHAQ